LAGADVEELFTLVELLRERRDSPLNPFVTWSPVLEKLAAPPLNALTIRDHIVSNAVETMRSISFLSAEAVAAAIEQALTYEGNELGPLTQGLLLGLRKLAGFDEESIGYLERLVEYVSQKNGTLVTLNYDETLETAARRRSVAFELGIDAWTERGRVEFSPSVLPIIKLHGSVSWRQHYETEDDISPPRYRIIVGPITELLTPPEVIFGMGNKLRASGPFLDLLIAFRSRLEATRDLVVIGYSFRDDHVNQIILEWLHQDRGRILSIVDPAVGRGDAIPWRQNKVLRAISAWGHRVALIPQTAHDWCSTLTSQTR
jgi:hypothetical protein